MSGDYETLEVNQPKISYFKKRSKNKTFNIKKFKKMSMGGFEPPTATI